MRFSTVKLVYKNMIWNRPKLGLYGLLFMAGFCTTNVFFSSLKFGQGTAWALGFITLTLWLIGLPMVFTLIDIKKNPQRMDALWKMMHEKPQCPSTTTNSTSAPKQSQS